MLSSQQTPGTRKPMMLGRDEFKPFFENLPFAHNRRSTCLCCHVKPAASLSPESRIFFNKDGKHAEEIFLTWFKTRLCAQEHYQITWYMSWTPCSKCAVMVADFLKSHSTVNLSIFAARLYYPRELVTGKGLRRLKRAKAQIQVMSHQDFEHCWKNFVDHRGEPFQPWENLDKHSRELATELEDILRNTDDLLPINTFKSQFCNKPKDKETTRRTYLCYKLKGPDLIEYHCIHYQYGCHAETHFIRKIESMNLDPAKNYSITCYMTWSPCDRCARRLISFMQANPHLRLTIYASRLHYHWLQLYILGLRHLQVSGVTMAVMTNTEFKYCWEEFVDNQGTSFTGWDKLENYSHKIDNRLKKILQPLVPDALTEDFEELHL